MKLIDINKFKEYKETDTVVIYGCGPSIKNLNKEDLEYLQIYDSISFNLFCKTNIPVKYYIIGELLHHYWRAVSNNEHCISDGKENKFRKLNKPLGEEKKKIFKETGEDPTTYLKLLQSKVYNDSKFILWNNCKYINENIKTINENIKNETLLLNITTKRRNKKEYKKDLDNGILVHSTVGLTACIYLAYAMKYKRIIFCGVDLNNYDYAFDRDKFRENIIRESKETKHRSYNNVISFINYLKDDIIFEVYNNDSLLTNIINVDKCSKYNKSQNK